MHRFDGRREARRRLVRTRHVQAHRLGQRPRASRELTAEDCLRLALHGLVQPRCSRRSPGPTRKRSQARRLERRLQRLEKLHRLDEHRPLGESKVPALIFRVTPSSLLLKRSLAALAVVLGLAALSATAASADASFEDPPGDAPRAAPDVTTVAVSNTPDGNVTFQITIANYQALPPPPGSRVHLSLAFDLDKNPSTGDVVGDEAQAVFLNLLVNNGAVDFRRWNGSEMVDVPETNMSSSLSAGVLTFTVNRSELVGAAGFAFRVEALTFVDGVGPALDFAPDDGYWTYDLVFPPPPPPTLSATKPVGTPTRPVAGRKFTVRSVVTRSDTGETVTAGSVRCAARIGTARLRAEGRFRTGRAQCVMTVPLKARGKTLRGSIAVRAAGASVTTAYSFRIV